jgi:hypothetical protein
MGIPKRINEIIEEHSNKFVIVANTGQMKYKTGGTFQGLLVETKIGEERIGYLTAEKRKDGNYVLDGVFVEENYRNNGIATDMLRKAQRTVQMTPYITTENQVYQSEAGKKLAEKEYRMMTASTLVIAGPLAAVPELIGAGEAAAGAGEAAAGAGEAAASTGETASDVENSNTQDNSQQQDNQQQSKQQQGGLAINYPAIEAPSPAHPNFTSSKLSSTIAWPETMPKTPLGLPNVTKPVTFNSNGTTPGSTINVDTSELQPATQTQTKQPPKAQESNETQSKPGGGLKMPNIAIDIAHPVVNNPTAANPRSSSVNDSDRLVNLINEIIVKKIAHENEWSPDDETDEEKVKDHDHWAEITHHGEYDMPGPKKSLPPTTWE